MHKFKTLLRLMEAPGDLDPMADDGMPPEDAFGAPPIDGVETDMDLDGDEFGDDAPDVSNLPNVNVSDTGKAVMCALLAFEKSPNAAKVAIERNPNAVEAAKRLIKYGLISSNLSVYELTDTGRDFLDSYGLAADGVVSNAGKQLAGKYLFSR